MDLIRTRIRESIALKSMILSDDMLVDMIERAANVITESLRNGGKILFCGNGGSASDALHLTGELVGRFQKERNGLAAISLNSDVASMTAISNDYGYDEVFARSVESLMSPKDVLVGISTSGKSQNIYRAILRGKEIGGKTIGLLGNDGGIIKDIVDMAIVIPNDCAARIQESHIMIGHIICELVENGCC